MREEIVSALGLVTSVNRQATKPGVLLQARDVCIDRPGFIEPRPGFLYTLDTLLVSSYARTLVGFAGHLYSFLTGTRSIDETANVEVSGFDSEPRPTQRTWGTVNARGSLYATGAHGIQKLAATTDTSWSKSGLQRALGGVPTNSAVTVTWLTNGSAVAYRFVIKRTDANNYVRRSAPSGRVVYLNSTGGTVSVSVAVDLQDDILTGDVLEVYRSAAVVGAVALPSDQLYLVASINLTGAQISARLATVVDTVNDAAVNGGTELYTNSTQLGILQSKERPPWCSDVALYNRMAFYGDTRPPWRMVLRLWDESVNIVSGFPVKNLFLVNLFGINPVSGSSGAFTTTAGLTTGTFTGGGVDARTLIGCIIVDGNKTYPGTVGNLQAYTKIVSAGVPVAGVQSIVFSKTALATGAVATSSIWPTMTVGGVDIYGTDRNNAATAEFLMYVAVGDTTGVDALLRAAHLINIQSTTVSAWVDFGGSVSAPTTPFLAGSIRATMFFEWRDLSQATAPVVVWNDGIQEGGYPATVSSPQFVSSATALSQQPMTTDARPGTAFISQLDEPEAVPSVNNFTFGDSRAMWRRALATRSALWVCKDDGVYRVAGYSPEALAADLVDPTVKILHSEAACASADIVYAWTTKGVVAISDAGIQVISEPIRDLLVGMEQQLAANPASAAGIFMLYDQTERRVILGVPATVAETACTDLYVWSERTQAWTTWKAAHWTPPNIDNPAGAWGPGPNCGIWDPGTGVITFASQVDAANRYILRGAQRSATNYTGDDQRTISIGAASSIAGVWTITFVTGWTPLPIVGDAFALGGVTSRITRVKTGNTVFEVDNDLLTAGAKPAILRAAQSRVQWNISSGRGFDLKLWTDSRIIWNQLELMTAYTMTYGTGTQVSGGYATAAQSVTVPLLGTAYDYARKVGVPMDAGLGATFQATLDVAQGGANFLVGGFAVSFELGGEEVSQ